jgi:hypothetical protein
MPYSFCNVHLLTYLLTYLLDGTWHYFSTCQKILLSYGTRRFITIFIKAHHWTLFWASPIQFAPSIPSSLRSILMLSFHLGLGLHSGFVMYTALWNKHRNDWTPDPVRVKKIKSSLCLSKHHALKMYCGSGGIAPCILDLGTTWR